MNAAPTFSSMLVHVDSSPATVTRLQLAERLAESFDAQVTALFAATPADLQYPFAGVGGGDFQVAGLLREFEADRRRRARALFDQVRDAGAKRLTWAELAHTEPLAGFATQALYSDLVLLGQRQPHPDAPPDVPGDFIASVLIESGKPALVVPYIGLPDTLARQVVVAWKPTREAARAVSAALPLLRAAERVHVALWSDASGAAGDAAEPIEHYLRSHGVATTVHRYGTVTRDIGEHLLSAAADLQADLLVMGCYGHSRAREWVLGGATRTLLQSMTLPVLLAH